MKTRVCRSVLSAFCCIQLLAVASAVEAPKGAIKVAGKIEVTSGNLIVPKSARITTAAKKVYQVVLDSRGRSLVKVMHREKAEIWGEVQKKGNTEWLRVIDYTDKRVTAAHELWRRMRCNACVALPAVICATPPAQLQGAKTVTGRFYYNKRKYLAWTRDAQFLWAATDNRLYQIDMKEKRLVRSFGKAEGLPDNFIYELASDGKTVWIVYRGGVAALKVADGKFVDPSALRSDFARVHLDSEGVWVVTNKGTFRLKGPDGEFKMLPALPSAARITKAVEQGVWLPHWARRTAHFIGDPVSIGGDLYVLSYGSIYRFSKGEWTTVSRRSWAPRAAGGRLWFLNAGGLNEYDPKEGKPKAHKLPEACRGRYAGIRAYGEALWLNAWPGERPADGKGGLGRFDVKTGKWKTWAAINSHRTDRVIAMDACNGEVWVLSAKGTYETRPAHPGMTYVKRKIFGTSGFNLHRFDSKTDKWESKPLPIRNLDARLICGQDGNRAMDQIAPREVRSICAGPSQVFAATRLVPVKYFGGYWPCINRIGVMKGGNWSVGFEHDPEPLRLHGEQPLVLNISNGELIRAKINPGDRILEGVGHDGVLGLFVQDKTHWTVTEGCVGYHDAATGKWKRIAEIGFRYYWDAICAHDDGKNLFVGSDRGLIGQFDIDTGAFSLSGTLKERCITRIGKNKKGAMAVSSIPAPIGVLPSFLAGKLETIDAETAVLEGGKWRKAEAGEKPAAPAKSRWFVKLIKRRHRWDKSNGNFLWDRKTGKPAYYVKEVFFPRVLCVSPDGKRVWLRVFTGLLRLDLPEAGGGK